MKNLSILALLFLFVACGNAQNHSSEDNTTAETTEISQTPAVKTLNQSDLSKMLADSNVVLIDVRTPGEVGSGHIKGAQKFIDINGSGFDSEISSLDKSKTYVMYCRSGARSGRAAQIMIDKGFNDVYNLSGGILNYSGEIAK